MSQLKAVNDAVYQAEDKIVSLNKSDVQFLKERLDKTGLKRIRICAHKSTEDTLQEMLIAFAKGSYIRPSKHIDKEESMHILEGWADFVFFDEQGKITHVIPVGDATTGRQVYCRTPNETYHTLLIRSDYFVIQETTQGPFKRSDTVFTDWAPEDKDTAAVTQYLDNLSVEIEKFRAKHK